MSSLPKLLKIKDYITLTGTILGIIALIIGSFGGTAFISLAFFLLIITLATDLLDGWIARKFNMVNELGIQLDSLNDSLTFGIAPGILIFIAFQRGLLYDLFLVIGCVIFILGAILRLARFNVQKIQGSTGYTGVPTPISMLMLTCFFYSNYFYSLAMTGDSASGIIEPFPLISYYILPVLLILLGWFNITTYIKFSAKGKKIYLTFILGAPLAPILGIIGLLQPGFWISLLISIFFFGSLTFQLILIIIGFYQKAKEEKKKKINLQ